MVGASWSSESAAWTVTTENTDSGARSTRTCGFLYLCAGYYRYDEGYTPAWPGQEDFAGRLIHPQSWPDDLDVHGKRIVVIGSGATAVTLVPALTEAAAHVTMLQRSPSFVMTLPAARPHRRGPVEGASGAEGLPGNPMEERQDRYRPLFALPEVPAKARSALTKGVAKQFRPDTTSISTSIRRYHPGTNGCVWSRGRLLRRWRPMEGRRTPDDGREHLRRSE